MKKKRFTEEQITVALRQAESGTPVEEVAATPSRLVRRQSCARSEYPARTEPRRFVPRGSTAEPRFRKIPNGLPPLAGKNIPGKIRRLRRSYCEVL